MYLITNRLKTNSWCVDTCQNKCDFSSAYKMQIVHFFLCFMCYSVFTFQVTSAEYNVTLSHDGPVVLGGTITFKLDIYEENGERPSGPFKYKWSDNALPAHEYEVESKLDTIYWSISYPREKYSVGIYEVEVFVSKAYFLWWNVVTSVRTKFYVTQFLNGNIEIIQPNKTSDSTYISSVSEANVTIRVREGDMDALMKATAISTYWFIDCQFYGQTNDLNLLYNFTTPDVSKVVEALIIASYIPPTTVPPPTTTVPSVTTTINATISNITIEEMGTTTAPNTNVSIKPVLTSTSTPVTLNTTSNTSIFNTNSPLPYICSNSSIIPADPNKTYGHFTKKINVRAPIMNITVEGTNWIQPWDMLSLNVTCKGSGPFYKCLQFHQEKYNVTGNETCATGVYLNSCNFSIIHFFLEPSVYTILIIMNNDVSKHIYPLTINIYKVLRKPQLSVIAVPVSCSLAAVVLIVFGIAYYVQSRARFTVEVADFDFGQNNPEMEYKTFTERLRGSFNNAIRPGSNRISGYKHLSNPEALQ
ncbi:uncharacterized protein LOC128875053 isoform X1 [Hylaeus volcanicus]|uniref:uncharacterized protein LOC128875053 isoform X1 n=1 Tax=Hylaeus volcanicus TaxID=313075 RepID=UPI0023B7FE0D|nr:uncharacterized protein LOC128875053 isoform X1 [Hylaeus volcanicus]